MFLIILHIAIIKLKISVLDASGNTPTALLRGNVIDMGFYDECLDVKENVKDLLIKGKYCYGGLMIPLSNTTSEKNQFISKHVEKVGFSISNYYT